LEELEEYIKNPSLLIEKQRGNITVAVYIVQHSPGTIERTFSLEI